MTKKRVAQKTAHSESMDKRLGFKFTDKQSAIIKQILSERTKVVFIDGPAGTAKSLTSIYCGMKELLGNTKDSFLYLRTAAESGHISLGARPGEINEKIHHLVGPLRDKMDEMLTPNQIQKLTNMDNPKVEAMPVNDVRGSSWKNKFIVVDEAQNFEFNELITVITRLGEGSKLIFCGDSMQSDIRKSGWTEFFSMFDDESSEKEGAFTFTFDKSDIVRSKFLKFVMERLEERERYGPREPRPRI